MLKLGLVASIQHLHLVFDYKKRFEDAGFEVEVPVGGARLTFPGQVLGCNYSGDDDEMDIISSLVAVISTQLDLPYIQENRLLCLIRTPEMPLRWELKELKES